jgi:hypothetical protein
VAVPGLVTGRAGAANVYFLNRQPFWLIPEFLPFRQFLKELTITEKQNFLNEAAPVYLPGLVTFINFA